MLYMPHETLFLVSTLVAHRLAHLCRLHSITDNPPERDIPEFEVAVKELTGNATLSAREDLLKEALITAQFDHPNVISLVGVVTAGSPMYCVLRYSAHGSLSSMLKAEFGVRRMRKTETPGPDGQSPQTTVRDARVSPANHRRRHIYDPTRPPPVVHYFTHCAPATKRTIVPQR